jgi:hypothetical protein
LRDPEFCVLLGGGAEAQLANDENPRPLISTGVAAIDLLVYETAYDETVIREHRKNLDGRRR